MREREESVGVSGGGDGRKGKRRGCEGSGVVVAVLMLVLVALVGNKMGMPSLGRQGGIRRK